MSLIFRSRRVLSRGLSSYALGVIALAGANGIVSAQEPLIDNPEPAVLAARGADASRQDYPPQSAGPAAAQSAGGNDPAPQTQPAQVEPPDASGQQTKRILGIIPNFRAVSANVKLPPETVKEKFIDATEDSFDYSAIFFPAVIAAYNESGKNDPELGEGAAGFGRYFWRAAVDQTSENYMVEAVFPTVTREDSRYYTLGHGGFFKRTGYAISRAVITRTNSGTETFNISEVVGSGVSSGLSNLYYPAASRSVGNTMSEWAEDVGIDAGSFWFREFWPDINRHLFHSKYGNAPADK